jgi:hypothetical protein
MRYIPLSDGLNQKVSIDLDGDRLDLNVVFNGLGSWFLNLKINQREINGVKLSTGVLHLESNNLPFDFVVSGEGGLDPYKSDDFLQRCRLYLVEKAEVEAIKRTEIRL